MATLPLHFCHHLVGHLVPGPPVSPVPKHETDFHFEFMHLKYEGSLVRCAHEISTLQNKMLILLSYSRASSPANVPSVLECVYHDCIIFSCTDILLYFLSLLGSWGGDWSQTELHMGEGRVLNE